MSARIELNRRELTKLFRDKRLPVNQIAKHFGVSRDCVNRNLVALGFSLPSISEGHFRSYASGKKANTGPAHEAARGRTVPDEEQARKAQFYTGYFRSPYESMMYEALARLGEEPVPNLVVGRYGIDLAFVDVKLAIEVDGGNWHSTPRKKAQDAEKTAFLESSGWMVLRFRFDHREGFDVDAYAREVAARLQAMRGKPRSARK